MQRLTKRTKDGVVLNFSDVSEYGEPPYPVVTQKFINKLAEYEDLEEQGLLLRLPCKVGNVVYTREYVPDGSWCAITDGKIHEAEVLSLGVNNIFSPPTAHLSYENGGSLFFFFSDFGKTVFLTKEEAEAKLKEMEVEE